MYYSDSNVRSQKKKKKNDNFDLGDLTKYEKFHGTQLKIFSSLILFMIVGVLFEHVWHYNEEMNLRDDEDIDNFGIWNGRFSQERSGNGKEDFSHCVVTLNFSFVAVGSNFDIASCWNPESF